MILYIAALIVIFFFAINLLLIQKPVGVAIPSTIFGFVALTIASFIGLFAGSTNKIEALLSPLGPLTFLSLTILILAGSAITKQKPPYIRWFLWIGAGILGLLTLFQFIPTTAHMLPFPVGIAIAAQIFKTPLTAAVGCGTENFLTAFAAARPANLTVSFTTNADFFLHMLTVYGLTGLAAAIVFALSLFQKHTTGWLVVLLLLLPPTTALLTMIALICILAEDNDKQPQPLSLKPWIRVFVGSLLLLTIAVSCYLFIHANPFLSRYHIAKAQTSLSLINNTTDRQRIAQLVAQAVQEAKIAVALNTQNVAAWENLGLTYQTIMPIASDAGAWALSAYQESAKLDPSNPTLFLNIGIVFVAQKDYDHAIAAFIRAIQLNPSYANAYYNVANAYTLNGDTVDAAAALTKAMKLVMPGSSDYYKVKNELDTLPLP